jgi:hypothetical protein
MSKNNLRTYEHSLKSPSPLAIFEGFDISQYVNNDSTPIKSSFQRLKLSEQEFLLYQVTLISTLNERNQYPK